ncbi:MAG: hypothetical protein NTZ44_00380 [Candidatus Nomurabacteria bacterium]|nr:hypothetical protein [Candidatus Nomurabacteria bacterium]
MESETRNCKYCKTQFEITEREMSMYEKINLMIPDICVPCRWKQHMAFWPFGKFRTGVSDLSGERLITVLPANARYPIYTSKEWWSDAWDAMTHGQDYDSSRSFFDQLKELQEKVPRPHQQGAQSLNCDWCDDAWESKNCYLSRSTLRAENLFYGYRSIDCKDSIDVSHVFTLDQCYDCTYCFTSYNLFFSKNCRDCLDSAFLFDCRNSNHCFMCWNLRGKSYCIENVQYTKEAYEEKMKEINFGSNIELQKYKDRYEEILRKNVVHRENFNIKTYDSLGTYMTNCKNCVNVFSWEDSENCTNCLRGLKSKDSIDMVGCWNMELSGNDSCCTNAYDLKYSIWCDGARYSEYCDQCVEIENCFGCVSLRKKKYCILNKQYSKEEYEVLKEKIISDMKERGEYGQFPPYSMGLCPYNFSTSAIYSPDVTKEYVEALRGYWEDNKDEKIEGLTTEQIPDSITEVDESFSKQALICPITGWRYNIAEGELAFLKRKNISIPRVHFDVRTKNRLSILSQTKSEAYTCTYCSKNIIAYYPKDWGYEYIACEHCYLKEIA